jgi:hypothetical protein
MINFLSLCDFSKRWQTGFQDPATPVMEGIIDLHHSIFFFLIVILITVLFLFIQTFEQFVISIIYFFKKLEYFVKITLLKNKNYYKAGSTFMISFSIYDTLCKNF